MGKWPIEIAQTLVLFGGVIYNLGLVFQNRGKWTYIHIYGTSAAFFFLLALRELSYGRVFFMTEMTAHGPEFIDMANFPYHTEIYLFLAAYMLVLLYEFVRHIPWKKLCAIPRPTMFFLIAALAASLSQIGEHTPVFSHEQGELVEELAELLTYTCLVLMSHYYHRYRNFH